MQLGEVIRAAGIGEVVQSRCEAYAVGDVVTTLTGFQEYVIIRDDVFSTPIPGEDDQLAIMSVYGPTGATAYFGMTDIGRPQPGETVVISAAAGATGSVAGQIAKIAGARVVGIAGGPQKCRAVVEDFGFDACIDYKNDDLAAALKQHCPHRVNVYFDNVGGPILDAVLGRLASHARVVLCGVISSYLTGEHPGPANYVNLLSKTALMQGFNALDQWGRFDEAFAALRQWEAEGRLKHRETIFEGIESCVDALNGLFTGVNIGKTLVKLSEPEERLRPQLSPSARCSAFFASVRAARTLARVSASCCFCSSVPVQVMVRASPASSKSSLRILKTSPNLAARPRKACAVSLLIPRQARTFRPSSVRVATPLSTVTMPRPASRPMASSATSCGGVKAPSVASDTRCTTCAASAGPSSSIAAVTNAARLRPWRPLLAEAGAVPEAGTAEAGAVPETGATEAGATEAGTAETGTTEAGTTETGAAEKSTTRHHCCFLSQTINLLDTTARGDVNEIDGARGKPLGAHPAAAIVGCSCQRWIVVA